MRRLFVVAVLLVAMVGLHALQIGSPAAGDPLTLATIGFVVLAAFAIAELGGEAQLPKVTGYILTGIALGPFAANVMSSTVVADMRMFNTLALGLIATTAGLELDLGGLRKLARTLGATIAIKILAGIAVVGGTLFVVESQFGILGLERTEERLGAGLVFAALSLGTSPAIALAIISESKAKGRLSDLVLGAAIVKDVVVVVCLAVAVAAAKALVGGGGIGAEVLVHVGEELGRSLLAGAILGGLLIAYIRWIKAEMLLFVASMVLVVAEISAALHLELLLVFIVAGVVVRNFSPYEHDLLHPLEHVSLPIFVVFFTNAGASVDLGATVSVLPLALAVCAARVVVYVVAGRVGGRFGGEPPGVRNRAWLGYLPQAGVTLGLTALASKQIDGGLGDAVATLGMAVVAINLLVGPVTLRLALRAMGEIGDDSEAAEDKVAAPATNPAELAPALAERFAEERARSTGLVQRWWEDVAEPSRVQLEAEWGRVQRSGATAEKVLELAQRRSQRGAHLGLSRLMTDLVEGLGEGAAEIRVPLERWHASPQPGDGAVVRWRKRFEALVAFATLRAGRRERVVPAAKVERTYLEPAYVELARRLGAALWRAELAQLVAVEKGEAPAGALSHELVADALEAAHRGYEDALGRAGSAALPGSALAYSDVEPRVQAGVEAVETLEREHGRWRVAAAHAVAATLAVAHTRSAVAGAAEAGLQTPLLDAWAKLERAAQGLTEQGAKLAAQSQDTPEEEVERARAALLPRPVARELRAAVAQCRRLNAARLVEPHLPELPDQAEIVVGPLSSHDEPPLRSCNLRDVVHVELLDRGHGAVEAWASTQVERLLTCYAAFEDAAKLLDVVASGESGLDSRVRAALERCVASVEPLAVEAREAADTIEADLGPLVDRSFRVSVGLGEALDGRSVADRGAPDSGVQARLRGFLDENVQGRFARLLALVRGEAARYAERRELRSRGHAYDPADMREFFVDQTRRVAAARPPAIYATLFADEPIRDPVLFTSYRSQLGEVVRAGRAWAGDPRAGNAILVTGTPGSGKSSLLGVARQKIRQRRVIELGSRAADQAPGVVAGLAEALRVEPQMDALVEALRSERTLIIVDDLHTRVRPGGREVLEDLRALEELFEGTTDKVLWLLAVDRSAHVAWTEAHPTRGWFSQIVELNELSAAALEEAILGRHKPSGAPLEFPLGDGLLEQFQADRAQSRFFSRLRAQCGGNLRVALRLWRLQATSGDQDQVVLMALTDDLAHLPFADSFDADALLLLSLLERGGGRSMEVLELYLGAAVRRSARGLVASTLVEPFGDGLAIAAARRDDVHQILLRRGLRRAGGEPR